MSRLAIVLAAIVLTAVAACGGSASREATATPSSADLVAVQQLLDRHATAFTARDSAEWSADLDTSFAAEGYRDHQRAVFTNVAGVPFAAWTYVVGAAVTDPAVLTSAEQRLDGSVEIVHVELRYALAVVDPQPSPKQLVLTVVRRSDGWKLAGDSDDGSSWQGPWDFGPLTAVVGPHTLVLVHPAHRADAATFQALVERSVPVVTGVWGSAWNDHVAVLIPDTAAEFVAVTGDDANSSDLAAVSIADSVTPAGTVLGARIVLNPTTLAQLDAPGRRLVIQHELTHIASRARTSDAMPTWLVEGFADYVGNLGSGRTVSASAPELAAEVRRKTLPVALPTSTDFAGGNGRLQQAYEESWLACRLIAARDGQAVLVRFYLAVNAAAGKDPATAAATGLRTLGWTVGQFTTAWRAYLTAQLA